MVSGILEAVWWVKLSFRAWQQQGTLNAGEGCASRAGDRRLCVPSSGSSQGPTKLLGPVTVLRVLRQPHLNLETDQGKPFRSAHHWSFSSCGRGRCQSAGGLCLRAHTSACFRAAWTLARSLSQRDRCAKETPVTSGSHGP